MKLKLKPFFLRVAEIGNTPKRILDEAIMRRVVIDVMKRNAEISQQVSKNIPFMR